MLMHNMMTLGKITSRRYRTYNFSYSISKLLLTALSITANTVRSMTGYQRVQISRYETRLDNNVEFQRGRLADFYIYIHEQSVIVEQY